MNINIETIIGVFTFFMSAIALFYSLRKGIKEEYNIDADTISKLYDTIEKQEKRYREYVLEQEALYEKLRSEFETYKSVMTKQITEIANDNARLRAWANKLVRQLENARITPSRYE